MGQPLRAHCCPGTMQCIFSYCRHIIEIIINTIKKMINNIIKKFIIMSKHLEIDGLPTASQRLVVSQEARVDLQYIVDHCDDE